MMKRVLGLLVSYCTVLILVQATFGAATLPFGDGFERTVGTSLSGDWSIGSGSAIITNSPLLTGAGTNLAYSSQDLSLDVADGTPDYTNVWWSAYAKITPQDDSEDTPSVGTNVAAFYVNNSGVLKAYSTNTWVNIATGLSTSSWHGFSVHLDYNTVNWDLYKTAASFSFGDAMIKQNSYPLGFNSGASQTKFQEFNVTGETYLDEVAVNLDSSSDPVNDGSPSSSVNASVDIYLNQNLTGIISKYFSLAESSMSGPLGDALKAALEDGDKVHIYIPEDSTDWNVFTHQGDGNVWSHSGGASNDPTIYMGTGLFVEFVDTTNRYPAMTLSYDAIRATATDVVLNGTTDGGWTACAWPVDTSQSVASHAGLQIPEGTGDRMYITDGDGTFRKLWWNNASSAWYYRGNASGETLTEGKAFWYYNASAADETWNADSL